MNEVLFVNHFGKRCHATVVDKKPDYIKNKWYQGIIDNYEIYSTSTLVDQFSYIAIKSNN